MPGEEFPRKSKLPLEEIQQAQRHLFLCIGPDCCSYSEGGKVWDVLKSESKRLSVPILRTKAACVRVCKEGPWLIVYPEGTWYGNVTPSRLQRILREHVEGGKPVEEWASATMPCLAHQPPAG